MSHNTLAGEYPGFVGLNAREYEEVNGGLAPLAAFGLGLLGTAIAAGVDEVVKRSTGKSVAEHAWDLIEKIF